MTDHLYENIEHFIPGGGHLRQVVLYFGKGDTTPHKSILLAVNHESQTPVLLALLNTLRSQVGRA